MLLKYRILGGLGAVLFASAAVVTSTAVGGAANTSLVSDTITFTARAFIAVPPSETKPGFATLVSRTCSLKSDHERLPVPCTVTGSATLTLTGGTLTGSIRSSDGLISINETFVSTGATTGTGTGSADEFDLDDRAPSSGTFTESFTNTPSGIPNILNSRGTIIVTDNGNQLGDRDNPTTTNPARSLRTFIHK